MTPKIVDKQEKKFAIAHAAGILFGEHGFERVKMVDVANAAGVGKGTIYEYFKNKEELLDGAFALTMDQINEMMRSAYDPEAPPLETLSKVTRVLVESMEHLGHGYRFFLEYMLHCSRKEDFHVFEDMLVEFRQGMVALLQTAIDRGEIRSDIHVENMAAAFAAWFDGAIFHWVAIPSKPSLREMAESYLDSFLNGVLTEKQGNSK